MNPSLLYRFDGQLIAWDSSGRALPFRARDLDTMLQLLKANNYYVVPPNSVTARAIRGFYGTNYNGTKNLLRYSCRLRNLRHSLGGFALPRPKKMNIGPNSQCIVRLSSGHRPVTVLHRGDLHGLTWIGQDDENKQQYVFFTTQIIKMNNIPHRFSRKNFDNYAAALGAALKAFPAPIEVDPTPYSVETYACRFRDARAAKKRFNYEHPLIDNALFNQHAEELSVAIQELAGTLLIGPRAAIKARNAVDAGKVQTSRSNHVAVQCTVEALEHVCALLDKRLLSPPPLFFVRGLDQTTIDSLEERYDVAFAKSETESDTYQIL